MNATIYSLNPNFDFENFLSRFGNIEHEQKEGVYYIKLPKAEVKVSPRNKQNSEEWAKNDFEGFKNFVTSRLGSNTKLKDDVLNLLENFSSSYGLVAEYEEDAGQHNALAFEKILLEQLNGVIFTSKGLFDSKYIPIVTTEGKTSDEAILPKF